MTTPSSELRLDQGPPVAIPLCHFVVALGFLLLAGFGGVVRSFISFPGLDGVAYLHTLFLGWIVLTIMGAMTQFVPVWSGVRIHSHRLAVVQLWFVTGGLVGFVAVLLAGRFVYLPLVALPIVLGIWAFVYNVGRTLFLARPLDVTEGHFVGALLAFTALAPLGYALAVDFTNPLFDSLFLTRGDVFVTHVTLALFGAVLLTVVGALYQLGQMFTGNSLTQLDYRLIRLETATLPAGVFLLALARGVDATLLARIGALGILLGMVAFVVVLTRLLARGSVERNPMTDRYRIGTAAVFLWLVLSVPSWTTRPLEYTALWGHPNADTVLIFGVFGFVLLGTLYHIVPFIIWLDRYSDHVGFEQVPMVEDLYSERLERIDLSVVLAGFGGLVVSELFALPVWAAIGSIALLAVGFLVFVMNLLVMVHRHGSGGLLAVFVLSVGTTPTEPCRNEFHDGPDVDE